MLETFEFGQSDLRVHAPNDYILLPLRTGQGSEVEISPKMAERQQDESVQSPVRTGESGADAGGEVSQAVGALEGCVEVVMLFLVEKVCTRK